ncbi:5' nucleotidase, NT5C type [Methanolapillus millepedarum]|uniref:Uncharacterized protein n=1 Tax=Methanolapillus millepedarum TaxID=3028296 RepID=A0AA96V202_9EURY|nr:hypothetical protein MsAc7_05310 [Methanosarcinaceae archaeon Ac7]
MTEKDERPQKILYIDMDNVLVDLESAIEQLDEETRRQRKGDKKAGIPSTYDEIPGIFLLPKPMPGAVESFGELCRHFDVYILSTAPWENETAWSDKLLWVKKWLNEGAYKRLILTHHKNLNKGDFLVDDRSKNGASEFEGEWIQFGSEKFPDWAIIREYLLERK